MSHPLGHLGVTYALHLCMAHWKARGQLYIRRNWTFFAISYAWDVMSGNRSKLAFFEGGWVTLSADFRGKGASPTNHCWYQSSRVITLSCGIKISAAHHLVLSQYTHLTDRQTDRQNCDSNTVRCIICSRTVKTDASLKLVSLRQPLVIRYSADFRFPSALTVPADIDNSNFTNFRIWCQCKIPKFFHESKFFAVNVNSEYCVFMMLVFYFRIRHNVSIRKFLFRKISCGDRYWTAVWDSDSLPTPLPAWSAPGYWDLRMLRTLRI